MAHTSNARAHTEPEGERYAALKKKGTAQLPSGNNRGEAANDLVYQGAANDAAFRDEDRGIQNARRHTVQSDFEKTKSIEAQAYGREKAGEEMEAANDEAYAQEAIRGIIIQRAEEEAKNVVQSRMKNLAQKGAAKNLSVAKSLKAAKSSTMVWEVIIVAVAYVIQFLFALLSLVGFGLQSVVQGFFSSSWVGKIVSYVLDIANLFPGETVGFICWGIAAVITICVFVGYIIWFFMTGTNVLFDTDYSFIIAATCFALNYLPATNLGPWLVIWVLYIEWKNIKGTIQQVTQVAQSLT